MKYKGYEWTDRLKFLNMWSAFTLISHFAIAWRQIYLQKSVKSPFEDNWGHVLKNDLYFFNCRNAVLLRINSVLCAYLHIYLYMLVKRVCVCVCVCGCVCECTFLWQMRTQICIMTQVWHKFYKKKVTFQDITPCPHFSKIINHTELVFWETCEG